MKITFDLLADMIFTMRVKDFMVMYLGTFCESPVDCVQSNFLERITNYAFVDLHE